VIAAWGRTANAPLRNGWEGTTGYGPTAIDRVRLLLEATHEDRLPPLTPIVADTNFPRPRPTSPLWPLLGSPLVVADQALALPRVAQAVPEWDRPTWAYAAPALPRVFWTGAWSSAGDAALRDGGALLAAARGDRAVLAPETPLPVGASGDPVGPLAASAVRVDGGVIEATVIAPRAGLAVVLDPWFPGWTATVDGAPVPLARADYAFMAVPVPAGAHALRLEYHPAQLGRGVAVALMSAALLLATLAWRRRAGGATAAGCQAAPCGTPA